MKKSHCLMLFAALAASLLFCGCRSDQYYQDQAVQRAREYLLENNPQMPLMEQEYVKFNRPFILAEQLSGSYRSGVAQICICWMTPGNPELYMVYGASGVRMIDWQPQRIIRKQFKHPEENYIKTASMASNALIQSYFDLLDAHSVNHIRYTLPGVWKCKFDLNSNPGSQLSDQALAAAEKLPRYVLAWKVYENDQTYYVVYGGTARNDRLEGFKGYFNGIYTEAEFKAGLTDPQPLIEPFGGITR